MSELFYRIFTENIPLLDVRAPVEFHEGAFPNAVNIPLLDDEQRHKVGTQYKREGKEAAIKLGNRLVSGEVKEQRLQQWQDFINKYPDAHLYCFRGGLRSRTTQQWLQETGYEIPLVNGGYKALRNYLIEQLKTLIDKKDFIVLGGQTGTGKTLLLNQLKASIDLEGLANHRGSSFGRMVDSQPSQIDFENELSIKLLEANKNGFNTIVLEDEAFLIGRIALPNQLHEKMKTMPLVLLEESIESRIEVIFNDYIISNYRCFKKCYGEQGVEQFNEYLYGSLDRIKKRLGGLRHKKIKNIMQTAITQQQQNNDSSIHRDWIKELMIDYYDPMYRYQLDKKQQRIVYRGERDDVLQWFETYLIRNKQ